VGAFAISEQARSRAFVELLAGGKIRLKNPDEARRYAQIVRRQTEIDVLVEANGLSRSIAESIHKTDRDLEMRAETPPAAPISLEFESLTSVATARLDDVTAFLGKEAALLAFFVGEKETSTFLVQDGTVQAWNHPVGREALRALVEAVRLDIEQGASAESRDTSRAELDVLTARIYRELLEPAFAGLTKSVVYIAPHGPLHYLPLSAVSDGRSHLVDRYTLLTTPSATALTYLTKKQGSTSATTLVLANPDLGDRRYDLPNAEREGAAIQKSRTDTTVFSGAEASETRLREWAPKTGVLHIAAHASLDVRHPLESAILLAADGTHDGRLTAGEVFGLSLPSSLVVLSACQTGLGAIASGDELIGLTRAFMYAGAPSVIATLWRIEDESTATLMTEFYERIKTESVANALRAAQLAVRNRYPHPFYWAAFGVYGLDRVVKP
jgi:CHAT domain-containing protein